VGGGRRRAIGRKPRIATRTSCFPTGSVSSAGVGPRAKPSISTVAPGSSVLTTSVPVRASTLGRVVTSRLASTSTSVTNVL
jgi:hypothetical protein